MLEKVKKWFGIEGLKIAVETEEKYNRDSNNIFGTILLLAKEAETVDFIKIKIIEKYSRGRGKNKLIDEYVMAEQIFVKTYEVEANTTLEIPFEINYEEKISNMDEIQRKNFLFGGLISAAKLLKNAKSIYRIEIEAKVKGTKFSPFVTKEIKIG